MASNPSLAIVKRFIHSCINSVEQLEILLLLRTRGQSDIPSITQELRTSEDSVAKRLLDLMRKHLISMREDGGSPVYAYDPPDELRETIDAVAAYYASHRVSVINLIFSKPPDALKGFSDAFRLKD